MPRLTQAEYEAMKEERDNQERRAKLIEAALSEAIGFESAKAYSMRPGEEFPVPGFTPQWCVDAMALVPDWRNSPPSE